MSRSKLLTSLLVLQSIGLLTYTYFVFTKEGADLLQVFLANVLAVNWSGQFNLDFLCYLCLSGLWIMWRNQFTTRSVILGATAMILGIVVFAPYILWLINKERVDIRQVLMGKW